MLDLRVKLKFQYHFLVCAILQRLDWHQRLTPETLQLENGEIKSAEILNEIASGVGYFLANNLYEKSTVEQFFQIEFVVIKIRARRSVS